MSGSSAGGPGTGRLPSRARRLPTRYTLYWGGVLALLLGGLYLTKLYRYVLFHSLAEGFSIVVACGIFMLAWNSRRFIDNPYLLFVGIAYLFVAGIDFVHTLAYSGMGVFDDYPADLSVQLWIGARYLEGGTLLIAASLVRRKPNVTALVFAYTAVSGLFLASLFAWPVFPRCFIDGVGLTAFKILSEYVICLFLGATIILLMRRRERFDPYVFRLLIASIVVTILSEQAFTLYKHLYGFPNLLGHYLKIISFYLIYKAIIQTGLVRPYDLLFRELKQGRDALADTNDRLARSSRELSRSNADLEQFARVISHDLQEPLRMVTSYLQLLERRYKEQLDGDAQEFIDFSVDGAERMRKMIEALLTYSRVGTRGGDFEPTDADAVCREAIANLETAIAEDNATVTCDELPTLTADRTQLVQLFQNLIGNAIKFHGPDPPCVHISAERQDGRWVISIRDNGIGIDTEHAERIFDVFQRLHTRQEYPGTGIGLSVCKRIVQRHHGRIWLESAPGTGTTFHFTLSPPTSAGT